MDQGGKNPNLKYYEGLSFPSVFTEEAVKSAINYKPKKGDIFIVSYPKCGSTWMRNIVLLILRHGKLSDDPLDFFLGCPFLELTGAEALACMVRPGAIKTHLPYRKVPMSRDAKYICVMRNPKDCVVSFYYHLKRRPKSGFVEKTFDEVFEYFLRGQLPFGDYFDHVVEWYEHRDDPNVYLVTYESLKNDIRGEVLKLARFIGNEYEKVLLDDPKVLDDVIYYSSFEFMKENEKTSKRPKGEIVQLCEERSLPPRLKELWKKMESEKVAERPQKDSSLQFIRKGIVGDWKSHLKPDQLKKLEETTAEKTKTSEVMSLWK